MGVGFPVNRYLAKKNCLNKCNWLPWYSPGLVDCLDLAWNSILAGGMSVRSGQFHALFKVSTKPGPVL